MAIDLSTFYDNPTSNVQPDNGPAPAAKPMSDYKALKLSNTAPEDILFGDTMKPKQQGIAKTNAQTDKTQDNPPKIGTEEAEPSEEEVQAHVEAAEVIVETLDLDPTDPMTGEFSGFAAARGLDVEDAKELATMHQKHNEAQWAKAISGWRAQAEVEFTDPSALSGAREIVSRYGDEELTYILDDMGFGNHPAVIRFLTKIAQARRGR